MTVPEEASTPEKKPWYLLSKENKYGSIASLYYLSVILIIGLPIWYKTTSPLRYSYSDVATLLTASQMIVNRVPITVIITPPENCNETVDNYYQNVRSNLRDYLNDYWLSDVSMDGKISYKYAWKIRSLTPDERSKLNESSDLNQFDNLLNDLDTHRVSGKIFIYLISNEKMLNDFLSLRNNILFGKNNFVFINEKIFINDLNTFNEDLNEIVINTVKRILNPYKSFDTQITNDDLEIIKTQSDTLKLFLNGQLDLIMNIITEDINDSINFKTSKYYKQINKLINYLYDQEIVQLLNIRVTTQMVYHSFDEQFINSNLLNGSTIAADNERLFRVSQVPELLNKLESRLVEVDSVNNYYINIFIPKDKKLLFINQMNNQKSNTLITSYRNSFIMWNNFEKDFLNGFKLIIRNLFDLPTIKTNDNHFYKQIKNNYLVNKMEVNQIKRYLTIDRILRSLSSLESIEKLLNKMNNIIIDKEISLMITESVIKSLKSIECLSNENLTDGYQFSLLSYKLSEKAYFNPKLLSLLYFPDDQKYAIYFPLFLPISLPLITSLAHLVKHFFNNKK